MQKLTKRANRYGLMDGPTLVVEKPNGLYYAPYKPLGTLKERCKRSWLFSFTFSFKQEIERKCILLIVILF